MQESLLLFVGVLGAALSAGTILGGSALRPNGAGTDLVDIAGGLLSMLVWLLFAWGATNVEVALQNEIVHRSHPALAILGVLFAVLMFVIAFYGGTAIVNVRRGGRDRV